MIKQVLNIVPRKYLHRLVGFVTPFTSLLYMGSRFSCPICGRKFRKLLPYGYVDIRENALCPSCLSLERHRMMWSYLKESTNFFDSQISVLHIAPEVPFVKRFDRAISSMSGRYITADLESPLAKVQMDVQSIPFGDNEFDVVFCNHVLEHVTDDKLALAELYRVLKPSGWGILLSPIDPNRQVTYEDSSVTSESERLEKFGQSDHLRVYGMDYVERLREAGFGVEEVRMSERVSAQQFEQMGFSNEILYVVHKERL